MLMQIILIDNNLHSIKEQQRTARRAWKPTSFILRRIVSCFFNMYWSRSFFTAHHHAIIYNRF